MRLPVLMASLSKCHSCRQYHYTAGKQPINILVGEISFPPTFCQWWRFVSSNADNLKSPALLVFRVNTNLKSHQGGERIRARGVPLGSEGL